MTGLLGSTILEVAIGMALLYLLLAIFCTTANEWIARLLKTRATMLENSVRQMLEGQQAPAAAVAAGPNPLAMVDHFYGHPLIAAMMSGGKHPSYLAPRNFAKTIMDLVTPQHPGSITFAQLEEGVKALPDGKLRRTLLALIQNTNGDLNLAQEAIEGWFNDTMDRLSGSYKRKTQLWTLAVATLLTLVLNADTIQVARHLWTEPAQRTALVDTAKDRAARPRPSVTVEYPNPDAPTSPRVVSGGGDGLTDAELAQLGQFIGWHQVPSGALEWLERLCGWILTIVAVSLGAPFWFDTLNKFMNIRSAGKDPDEKAKTS